MYFKAATVTGAALKWKTQASGANYQEAAIRFEVTNIDRHLEHRIGFYGAMGHLLQMTFSPLAENGEKIVLKDVPIKLAGVKYEVPEAGGDAQRVTVFATSWNNEWGELSLIGESFLNCRANINLRFNQGELDEALKKFAGGIADSDGIDSMTIKADDAEVTITKEDAAAFVAVE